MDDICENVEEHASSLNAGDLFKLLNNYQLLKIGPVPVR
jgi:hypothetical protein